MSEYVKRRPCFGGCGKNRAEKFFTGPKGRTCLYCRRTKRRQQVRDLRVKNTYGMTKDDTQALLSYQGGLCAICRGRRDVLDNDHDHAKERAGLEAGLDPETAARESVRGLLCARCNRQLLKHARNDPTLLRAAADYLENPPWAIVKAALDADVMGEAADHG